MRSLLDALIAGAVALVLVPAQGWADEDDEDEEGDEETVDVGDDEGESERKPAKPARKAKAVPFKAQNLTGHDLDADRKTNQFEKDRFFVDKVDSKKTAKGTLIQGSLTSTSFVYREVGGVIEPAGANVPSASEFTRLFTDLRLQTDFRHIAGSRWEARVDVRGRFVTDPGQNTIGFTPTTNSTVQSGLLGANELDIKELWLIRHGKRADVFFGRQFIPDLGGVKIDGLRFDYASSNKFTFITFGGLFPIRGSRSIDTDYLPLLSSPDEMGNRSSAGRFTGTGGFGAAYRTQNAYGAFGGVAQVPLSSEPPRIFGTATGYWRAGTKLDIYHFAVIDAVGSNAVNAGLTNLSAGLNYKPDQRLRATVSVNRVDTETLNVQAQAFLQDPDKGLNAVQNEAFLLRTAQNQARASLSAGLGSLQRFEVTTSIAFRYRNGLTLTAQGAEAGGTPQQFELPAGKSAEVYAAITDRRSFAKLRLGVDGSRVFRVGDATYQRTSVLGLRAFASRELASGHGEWEAEVAYSTAKDDSAGMICGVDLATCFGASASKVLSAGGSLYYRFNRDWYGMGALYLNRQTIEHSGSGLPTVDPPITGLSGFVRAAYRF